LENCETSAIGRALGIMGIGLDNGVASYQEVKQAKKSQEQAMARSTDYKRVDEKVNIAVKSKLISKDKHLAYKKLRGEGMLRVDLVEMEQRIDKLLEGK
jgi:ATP:corrinoid adenosyltransferase